MTTEEKSAKLDNALRACHQILKENDMAGVIIAILPGKSSYLVPLDASWNAFARDGGSLGINLPTGEPTPDQLKRIGESCTAINSIIAMADHLTGTLRKMSAALRDRYGFASNHRINSRNIDLD